ncbi:MAG: co-chaperone GroES [Bacteroidota bacterium]|nr:co-chaperone GroES [Bacteroidota bacterium]
MKELQAINQNVIIKIEEQTEQKTASGIFIPESAKEKKSFGKVVSISNIENPEISAGDTVLYKEFTGTEIEFENQKLLLIQYSDILAKIVETEEI